MFEYRRVYSGKKSIRPLRRGQSYNNKILIKNVSCLLQSLPVNIPLI